MGSSSRPFLLGSAEWSFLVWCCCVLLLSPRSVRPLQVFFVLQPDDSCKLGLSELLSVLYVRCTDRLCLVPRVVVIIMIIILILAVMSYSAQCILLWQCTGVLEHCSLSVLATVACMWWYSDFLLTKSTLSSSFMQSSAVHMFWLIACCKCHLCVCIYRLPRCLSVQLLRTWTPGCSSSALQPAACTDCIHPMVRDCTCLFSCLALSSLLIMVFFACSKNACIKNAAGFFGSDTLSFLLSTWKRRLWHIYLCCENRRWRLLLAHGCTVLLCLKCLNLLATVSFCRYTAALVPVVVDREVSETMLAAQWVLTLLVLLHICKHECLHA